MIRGTRPAWLRLLVASTWVALCLSAGCVDLSPPWDGVGGQVGSGGKTSGTGGSVGAGGDLLDGATSPDLGHHDDGGDAPSAGSGGTSGLGGAGGFAVDSSEAESDVPQGGGGGQPDAAASTGEVGGTGGANGAGGAAGTGGGGSPDSAVTLDGAVPLDASSDAVFETAVEVSVDLASDSEPDAPIEPPDLGPDFGPDLGSDLGPDSTPDANPLLVGLVAYYACEDSSGTSLSDSSGHGYHGTLSGGFTLGKEGRVGSGLTLAKSGGGYASLPPQVFAGLEDVTVAAWVYPTAVDGWARIFDTGINAKLAEAPSSGTKYMGLTVNSPLTGKLRLFISENGYSGEESLNASSPTSTNQWQHVVITLEKASDRGSLYINGSAVVTNEETRTQLDDLGDIDYAFLGKSQFSVDPYFDGIIDEFRVYDRVLSASEVQALYEYAGP